MHDDFADWYRVAGIEPTADELSLRWKGIEEYALDRNDIAILAPFFFGVSNPNEAFLESFRAPFKTADATFKMTKNENELRVLAGAALVDTFENAGDELAILAALSLVSSSFQNLRHSPIVPAIAELAAISLADKSSSRANPETDEEETETEDEIAPLRAELSCVSEEVNMLWWLISEQSRDEGKLWADLGSAASAMVSGKELADLTRVLPGPMAALAFLSKIGRFAENKPPKAVAVRDAINDAPMEWRKAYVDRGWDAALDAMVPLSLGIKQSVGSPGKNSWVTAFKTASAVSDTAKVAPHLIAYQMFIEGMLFQSWKKAQENP